MDFTVREYGLQIDQPPAIGNLSSLMVIIQKNDNAEGILEFDPKYVNITGTFIPLALFFSCFVIYYFFMTFFIEEKVPVLINLQVNFWPLFSWYGH